ncbi:uncharacterized protein isoform X3 [Danio rerio]|uniref:Uncharacterized protein isoform X3 n=1 Tax=Danio rerio TaxID=7955 RepID=A0AC58JED1_DANRE
MSGKSHKAMSDADWISRLKKFASTGVWPSNEGNRPAPRQKKWHEIYQRIEKCPLQSRGQRTLLGGVLKCTCGFHTQKQSTASAAPAQTVQQPAPTVPAQEVMETRQLEAQPQPPSTPSVASKISPQLSMTQDLQVSAPVLTSTTAVTSSTEPSSIVSTAPSGSLLQAPSGVPLPRLWAETLPPEDHKWIASRLFKMGSKGKPELRDNLQLWYYPPQPALTYNQAPAPDRFFCHSLLLWMPYKLWRVKVLCPNPACGQHQLTGGGLHKRARQVLDIDRMYNMVTETLICTKCKASHVSWSQTVLQQLDLGHRSEFRVILTQK